VFLPKNFGMYMSLFLESLETFFVLLLKRVSGTGNIGDEKEVINPVCVRPGQDVILKFLRKISKHRRAS